MEDKDRKIQEMHIIEQNLHNLLLQKQAFQIELTETSSALEEVESSTDEVFKIIGQLLIKTDKSKMKEELLNKKKMLELRLKTIEKQENSLTKQLNDIREGLIKSMEK